MASLQSTRNDQRPVSGDPVCIEPREWSRGAPKPVRPAALVDLTVVLHSGLARVLAKPGWNGHWWPSRAPLTAPEGTGMVMDRTEATRLANEHLRGAT